MKRKQPEKYSYSTVFSDRVLEKLMKLKIEGLTYEQIADELNTLFKKKFNQTQVAHAFTRYKIHYELPEIKTHPEKLKKEAIEKIKGQLADYIRQKGHVPTKNALVQFGANYNMLAKYFDGEVNKLVEALKIERPEVFKNILDESSFTHEDFKKIVDKVKGAKKILITTAVNHTAVHDGFFKACRTWLNSEAKNKGEVLVLTCADPAKRKNSGAAWVLDPKLKEFRIIWNDIWLNSSIYLSTIKTSAKQIKPTTGLRRFVHKRGSYIMAGTKQFINFVATSNVYVHRVIATTGAITVPDYSTDRYMSERLAYIANEDHCLGGIIIEIKDDNTFLIRNFQAETKSGNFRDLNKEYRSDGTVRDITPSLISTGDYHVGNNDPVAVGATKSMITTLKPKYVTVEDFFTGYSINPHERKKRVLMAKKAAEGKLDLDRELEMNTEEINRLLSYGKHQIIKKQGNHELFLERYLDEEDYRPENRYVSVCLEKVFLEGQDPLKYAMENIHKIDEPNRVIWLDQDEEYIVNGINVGPHGHLGAGGKRNPGLQEIEDCYGPCSVGHNHSGAVWRNIFRAGTLEFLRAGYNHGPGAWTFSNIVQHENGSRQLITIINGLWSLY